ncbi:hypothetical protein MCOR27_006610 [Pyricularia oryzae]|uniref:Succinate dehydrogenase assembly factor 4, mitochondrial n=1 Tax=Pyricularia grisea TaxID=148305 RepID=A0ABQ8NH65_PYRGI|nr:hypothetical protein MCOR01_006679 [Pyricularia oryzae]KAI6296910.1 hypothetical protein MCOR33_006622 [Pyricularia grisea]KAI6276120.1 hypothetical protein MCOR27_006610 [Pyricularia oryzae]KAI6321820.1 hypothetical protein MCOR29_004928 [Pyricularia oryzae]KAI6368893.1 hypothetical protein MCOR31_005380 [Pyricularia oryzae]
MSPTRTLTLLTRNLLARPLTTTRPATRPTPTTLRTTARASSTFNPGPSPPRLPAEQQAEFERLQREASVADFASTPAAAEAPRPVKVEDAATNNGEAAATSGGIRKGAPPEFEGEVNPKTGEVGGPKNEPLRWGAAGDYSFNGRVTDF